MSEKEELERLKAEKARRDEGERSLIISSLIRIEKNQAVHAEGLENIKEEQKKTTKILYGDESENKPGILKRIDRLEGKMKLFWGAVVAAFGAMGHTLWSMISGGGEHK